MEKKEAMEEKDGTCMEFHHSEESIRALSRMQYDLFHLPARLIRGVCAVTILILAVASLPSWWAFFLIFYGSFLLTGRYREADRKANRIIQAAKESGQPFPRSRYVFRSDGLHVYSLPDEREEAILPYAGVQCLAEDRLYYFLFRDRYGGYCLRKKDLGETKAAALRSYLEKKTGQRFQSARVPAKILYHRLFRHVG